MKVSFASFCVGRPTLHTLFALQVIQLSPSRRPTTLLVLDPSPAQRPSGSDAPKTSGHPEGESPVPYSVISVAWAPSCGRSYHLIATGSRDGHVRIWRVKPPTPLEEADGDDAEPEGSWSAYVLRSRFYDQVFMSACSTIVGDFDDHKSAIGRVEWNITGYASA